MLTEIRAEFLRVVSVGRVPYAEGCRIQEHHHVEVLAARDAGNPEIGRLLLLEHDPPVITVSRRAGALAHLTATPEQLARAGVEIAHTDRGGDITYHGPGQLVAYPILDLNTLGINLHGYMRFLEERVIEVLAAFGVSARREPGATGVWVEDGRGAEASKICAMGVRVRRWVTMHGLALNITTDLEHFGFIVPCGLHGRSVTSLERIVPGTCPSMQDMERQLARSFERGIVELLRAGSAR